MAIIGIQEKKGDFWIYFISILIGWMIRVLYVSVFPVLSRDSYYYMETIRTLNSSGYERLAYIGDHTPPLALELFRIPLLFWGAEFSKGAIALNVASSLLIIFTLIKIAKEISQRRIILLIIGLLAATNPTFVKYSANIQREIFFLVFCSLAALYLTKYWKGTRIEYVVDVSILSTLATLTRHEGVELFVFSIVLIFLKNIASIKKIAAHTFLLLGSSILTFLLLFFILGMKEGFVHQIISFYMISINKLVN